MKLGQISILSFFIILSGCMTLHDPNISKIGANHECNFSQGVIFNNSPHYLSDGDSNSSSSSLSSFFGAYDKLIERVRLQKNESHLIAEFFDAEGNQIVSRKSSSGVGYKTAGKRLIINQHSSCKPGEAGVGCVWWQTELSCTQDGSLAIKEVTKGAGMIALVIPIGTSMSSMALYKPAPNVGKGYTIELSTSAESSDKAE